MSISDESECVERRKVDDDRLLLPLHNMLSVEVFTFLKRVREESREERWLFGALGKQMLNNLASTVDSR